MIRATVLLLCAGQQEVTEISGSYPSVEKFKAESLSKKATRLALPVYITPMYVMNSKEDLEDAKIEWEKYTE